MSAQILDGKTLAKQLQSELAHELADFIENNGVVPALAAILVGDDAASDVYVRNKRQACERVGLESRMHRLPAATSEDELLGLISKLNRDENIHGILLQLPLPPHLNATRMLDAIHPLKDVDAFHPENVGRLAQGRARFRPCTPYGVQWLLHRSGIPVSGKEVVVVGRSDIVGKPIALMLMQRDSPFSSTAANATVTVCHSRSANLKDICRRADVLIAAIGQPRFITADMVKPGAAVVDIGINRTETGLVGDVDFDAVKEVAAYITPVPGGVGPLTVTMLLYNTLEACRLLTK